MLLSLTELFLIPILIHRGKLFCKHCNAQQYNTGLCMYLFLVSLQVLAKLLGSKFLHREVRYAFTCVCSKTVTIMFMNCVFVYGLVGSMPIRTQNYKHINILRMHYPKAVRNITISRRLKSAQNLCMAVLVCRYSATNVLHIATIIQTPPLADSPRWGHGL